MSTRKSDPGVGGEKQGTIEIAYVKLAGNDATLQEAVKAFNALINRQATNGAVLPGAKRVNSLPAVTKATSNGHGDALPFNEEDDTIEVDSLNGPEEGHHPPAPVSPKPQRKYSMPTAISIDTEAGMSVDDFVKQYKLESNEEKYLALAGWLRAHRQVPLKAGLIVTLFKHLDWTLPADVTMPLRRMVNKKLQWLERVGTGDYQIHQIGESKLAKLKA